VIALDAVAKSYSTSAGRRLVLDNATVEFLPGYNFGILGANGAGKSTLIRLLAGSEMPDRGTIRRHVRVSFPLGYDGAFHPALSGRENVAFIARVYGAGVRQTLRFVEEFAELDEYFDRLDAAFAGLGTEGHHGTTPQSEGDDEFDGRAVPTLESLLAVSAGASDDAPAIDPVMPVEVSQYNAMLSRAPAPRAATAPREAAEPVDGRNLVADMFAALFAVEQGESVAPAVPLPVQVAAAPVAISEGLVDEVTRRVVERLAPETANELVAQIVSEVAERLIREEITRIKAAAAARPSPRI